MTQLRTADFLLRPLVPADAPALVAAVRESADTVGKWMGWAHAAYGSSDAEEWIAHCAAARRDGVSHEFGIFRAEGEVLLGAAGLNQFNRINAFCNLGYWLRQSAQRQGAGLAAVHLLARHAFEQLGQHRVEIIVAEGNAASLGLARKAGAVHECLARNRVQLHGRPHPAHVLSLVPETPAERSMS
ncbi:GNAT family N-acetyltransferase [Pseudoduganella sp. SL102]|uniref:GNAT family N-acetyltransferase n=1 Tax=Pseudoduganella sp. SL102 TaxID=2995154 RepID=UPI00248C93D1|nr:GNAT family N-acetyltransferase [Pseudoduganella sp. SL102]WBS00860.1 GNAT family N-acetyltransferase [Pseudoduganella sp. SL102]